MTWRRLLRLSLLPVGLLVAAVFATVDTVCGGPKEPYLKIMWNLIWNGEYKH